MQQYAYDRSTVSFKCRQSSTQWSFVKNIFKTKRILRAPNILARAPDPSLQVAGLQEYATTPGKVPHQRLLTKLSVGSRGAQLGQLRAPRKGGAKEGEKKLDSL